MPHQPTRKTHQTPWRALASRRPLILPSVVLACLLLAGGATYVFGSDRAHTQTHQSAEQRSASNTTPQRSKSTKVTVTPTPTVKDDTPQPSGAPAGSATQSTAKKSNSTPVRRRDDSTNPAWIACVAAQSQQYATYQADNARINTEKKLALAELDRMYTAGEFTYDEDGEYYDEHNQYNIWQLSRTLATEEYDAQLMSLYARYSEQAAVQERACEATYDH